MTTATMACEIATAKYPQGRTGTTAGYQAHRKRAEPICDACRTASCAEARDIRNTVSDAARRRAHYVANWDAYSEKNLKAKHGMTMAEYELKLEAQGGGCAICGTKFAGGRSRGRFYVDHDHRHCDKTSCAECQRGLLCSPCNVGLGSFGDDVEKLMAAASYLMSWEGRTNEG